MKNLIQITTVLLLLVQTIGYGQTGKTVTSSKKQDTSIKIQDTKAEIGMQGFENFLGEYLLEEANFILEIIQEDNKLYIVTEFSKDILIPKNDTTLHEITRGVDLELIKDTKNALKFSQNGYVTTIKRVAATTEK